MVKDLVLSPNVLPSEVNINKIREYDVIKTIANLQEFIYDTPRVYNKFIVDETVVPFNTTSLHILYNTITNGFLKINEDISYVTTKSKSVVEEPLLKIFKDFKISVITVKELTSGYLTNVINGTIQALDDITYTQIHKVKIADYIKNNGKEAIQNKKIVTDTTLIQSAIQKEIEKVDSKKTIVYLVNIDKFATAVFSIIAYNNLAKNNKVFLTEFDKNNYMSDLAIKMGIKNYSFDHKNITDDKSLLLLSNTANKFSTEALNNYVYNTSNYDIYIQVVDLSTVAHLTNNIFFTLVPTAESMSKVLTYLNTYNPNRINLVLVYKGFVFANEFTPLQVLNTIESKSNTKVNLESFLVRSK